MGRKYKPIDTTRQLPDAAKEIAEEPYPEFTVDRTNEKEYTPLTERLDKIITIDQKNEDLKKLETEIDKVIAGMNKTADELYKAAHEIDTIQPELKKWAESTTLSIANFKEAVTKLAKVIAAMEKYAVRAVLEPESETKYKQMQQDLLKKEKEILDSHLRDFKEQVHDKYYNFSKDLERGKGFWFSDKVAYWVFGILMIGYLVILCILKLLVQHLIILH